MTMLQVDRLNVAYGSTQVLFEVSFGIEKGDLLCVMGRNGVGKSTLLKTVVGVLNSRAGSIRWQGRELRNMAAYDRVRLGIAYVPQGHETFPQLSVHENLKVVVDACGGKRSVIDEVIDLFPRLGPLLKRPAGLLSGGQKQQLGVARALVTNPQLLVLDEPTEGLQPSIVLEMEEMIQRLHRERGLSILLAEQYFEFAMRVADRYVVLDAGRVVAEGDTRGLADNAAVRELVAI
jgi:urea transport system ATP-binding protein